MSQDQIQTLINKYKEKIGMFEERYRKSQDKDEQTRVYAKMFQLEEVVKDLEELLK